MITLIQIDHFTGQRFIFPDPKVDVRDLAKLIRELQDASNTQEAGDTALAARVTDLEPLTARVTALEPAYAAVAFADTPYTIAANENLIGVDTTDGAVTVVLPAPGAVVVGAPITVKDEGENAGTANITIDGNVDGSDDPKIDADLGKLTVYSNGTAWFTK